MHIVLVVLAMLVVTSVMVVMLKIAMTYLVTCKFTGTRQVNLQELPFVLLLLRISGLTTSICIFDCSYFLAISFGFMGILLKFCECSSEYLKIGFVSKFQLYFSDSSVKFSSQGGCAVKPQ